MLKIILKYIFNLNKNAHNLNLYSIVIISVDVLARRVSEFGAFALGATNLYFLVHGVWRQVKNIDACPALVSTAHF